jgi:hypothetical protein
MLLKPPPRSITLLAQVLQCLGVPLAQVSLLLSMLLSCGLFYASIAWLKMLCSGLLWVALLCFIVCLKESLRIVSLLRQGKSQMAWLQSIAPHPTRKKIWLGVFELSQGPVLRLELSHARWQEGQIYLLLANPVDPNDLLPWGDLPVPLKVDKKSRLVLKSNFAGLILVCDFILFLFSFSLVWARIAG